MPYLLIFVIALSLLSGCNGNETSPPSPNAQNGNVKVQQTDPGRPADKNTKQIAAHLEELAMSVPKVKGANCVLFGNTAVVGIDVADDLDRAHVGTVKYSVAEALREDPYGANAVVTADMDLNARLREIRNDIRRGRTMSGFAEEMADIVGRIVPQLPRDTAPQGGPDGSEDTKRLPKRNM